MYNMTPVYLKGRHITEAPLWMIYSSHSQLGKWKDFAITSTNLLGQKGEKKKEN